MGRLALEIVTFYLAWPKYIGMIPSTALAQNFRKPLLQIYVRIE